MHLRKNESGSIMLEVVAVLALMGVMGAMLFRQVFQRNQELHNIQMASEIRTVKEAYSAYIQANKALLMQKCLNAGMVNDNQCGISSNTLSDEVTGYLPEGWFGEAGEESELKGAYNFYIYTYLDSSNRQVLYGLVVPTDSTLPESNWNFKRAARIALLVGADGGAYDDTITNGEISGSLGSWHMPINGIDIPKDEKNNNKPIYAATTGIDIFVPEYEPPEGNVNLPKSWDLALQNVHAYGTFSAGNSGTTDCYNILHDKTTGSPAKVYSDTVFTGNLSDNCKPLFWVENGITGKVNVATDLNIGEIVPDGGTLKHNEALKLTKEGRVVQKEGLTIGTDGRIIAHDTVSTALGDLANGENYVLDPAYTSTMNDIRLASRGGVRLSEILPNYILKSQKQIECTIDADSSTAANRWSCGENIAKPTCPRNYHRALVVIPTRFGREMASTDLQGNTANISTESSSPEDPHVHQIKVSEITGHVAVARRQFQIRVNSGTNIPQNEATTDVSTWQLRFVYTDGDVSKDETIQAIVQTYCVFDNSVYSTQDMCEAAGWKWNGSSCTSTRLTDAERVGKLERSENSCKEAGYFWDDTKKRCRGNYAEAATINSYGDNALKEKACKAAGRTWNSGNHSCTN